MSVATASIVLHAVSRCCNPTHSATTSSDATAAVTLQVCARCKVVSYCCRACQIAHWKQGHKQTCQAVSTTADPAVSTDFLESEFARFRSHEAIVHHQEVADAPQYVHVLQGRAAYIRSDRRTPQHVAGLFTEGFSSCNVLILTATTADGCVRIEMLHIDEAFPMTSLTKELDDFRRFDRNFSAQLLYKNASGQGVRDRLRQVLEKQHVAFQERAVTEDAVSIRRDGTHLHLSETLADHGAIRLLRHPKERAIKLVSKVHEVIGHRQASWTLHLFCEDDWMPCDIDTRLTEHTQAMLRSNGLQGSTHLRQVEATLRRMHGNGSLPHLGQRGQDLENVMRIGALYVAEYLRRRDGVDFASALQQDVHKFVQVVRTNAAIISSNGEVKSFLDECVELPKDGLRALLAAKIVKNTDMRVLDDIYDVVFHLFQMLRLYDYCTLWRD